jgi:hypothetical protein
MEAFSAHSLRPWHTPGGQVKGKGAGLHCVTADWAHMQASRTTVVHKSIAAQTVRGQR